MSNVVKFASPNDRYTLVDNRIIDANISPESRLFWIWLSHHRDGFEFTASFVEAGLDCSKDRRLRMQNELVEAGFLRIDQRRDDESGRVAGNIYELTIPESESGDEPRREKRTAENPPQTIKKEKQVTTRDAREDESENGELQRLREMWSPACPDVKGRTLIPRKDRMQIHDFDQKCVDYFSKTLSNPPGRAIVTLAFYAPTEVEAALLSTAKADRPSWRYFVAALEGGSRQTRATESAPTDEERREYEFILAKPADERTEAESAIVEKVKAWKARGNR